MKIEIEENVPKVYIKVELDRGKIWGRSFHYSNRKKDTGEESEESQG